MAAFPVESVAGPVTPAPPPRRAALSAHAPPTSLRNPMSTYKSDFLNVLADRGFIHQVSEPEALDALARKSTITGYIGFDCTAPSLHIGSLLPIMLLVLAAADRPSADRADGRRHHPRRRSVRQGREPPAPHRRGHQRKSQRHPRGLRQIPEIRRRAAATPSWPTTPTGSTRSITSTSCATSAGIFPSTACWPSIR